MVHLCAKLHCDRSTNKEDMGGGGCPPPPPPPNLNMLKQLSPIRVNLEELCHAKLIREFLFSTQSNMRPEKEE